VKIVSSIGEVRREVAAARAAGKSIGFVPTMGALHEGHLSLVRRARAETGCVAVSVFVNPTQFGPGEDYASYPRNLAADAALCEGVGTDLLFAPAVEEMYTADAQTFVDQRRLPHVLCGASRPGHFRGVLTVVLKLFNIVTPDRAYFGAKDYQQTVVIRRMVADLNLPVEIVVCPTVRERNGLAMSSRNAYLTSEERERAGCLYRTLERAQELVGNGVIHASTIEAEMKRMLAAVPGTQIDYVAVVDPETLEPLERIERRALAALAVRIGRARLIDNRILEVP